MARRRGARVACLLLGLLLSAGPHAAAQAGAASDESLLRELAYLEGRWEGEIEGSIGSATGLRQFRFILGDRFLWTTHQRDPGNAASGDDPADEWSIFSFDADRGIIVLREFLTEGLVNRYACTYEASPRGLVCESEASENGSDLALSVRYELVDSVSFTETFEVRGPDGASQVRMVGQWRRTSEALGAVRVDGAMSRPPVFDSLITSEGIGPVTRSMSERDLIRLLGDTAVTRSDVYIAEGFCATGSLVFPGSDAEIEVTWRDTTYAVIAGLSVRRPGSPWRTPAGVGIGTTLEELESIAGAPIEFSGFAWDYGGGAAWTEGLLHVGLRLAPTPESDARAAEDDRYAQILGDRTVRSDHPVIRGMTVVVEQIFLSLAGSDENQFECEGVDGEGNPR